MTTWQMGTLRAGPIPPAGLIVKVGGSLLGLTDWPDRLAELIAPLGPKAPRPLLVVGGGRVVDGLREIDAANPRPQALMHDLAIDAMSFTARIVADALGLPVVGRAQEAGVLDAATWLRSSGRAPRLPAGWHVTSDSIAALVAAETSRGLLLAKRAPPPGGRSRPRAAGRGRLGRRPLPLGSRHAGDDQLDRPSGIQPTVTDRESCEGLPAPRGRR